jgi:hypothetical protein
MELLIAYILGLLTAIQKPSKDSKSSITPNTKTKYENDGREVLPALQAQIPPTPQTTEQSCKCCHHKTPRWKILLDWLTFIAALAAAAAATWYACITNGQWQTAKDSLEAQTRPWIEIVQPPELQVVEENRLDNGSWEKAKVTGITVQFRNDGHSTAILGTPQFSLTDIHFRLNRQALEGDGACKQGLKDVADNLRGITTAVFPGAETPPQKYDVGPSAIIGDMVGCVVYRNGATIYRTQYVWRLERVINAKMTKGGLADSVRLGKLMYVDAQ